MRLRYGRPLWLDRPAPRGRLRFPQQRGALEVDVVIIGGGITGAVTAYLFSEAGIRVALVEGATSARGSTSASTALLMQEPDRDFRYLARKYGSAHARRIWILLRGATHEFTSAIRHLKIDCDLRRRASIYFTLDPDRVGHLRRELRDRKRAGLAARWLSPRALQNRTGIRGQGAILTTGNADADPVKACMGFLRAAKARGALIFEGSPVRRVTTSKESVIVKTARGVIHARSVIVATGYATTEFKPLAGRFRLMDTYVIATPRRQRRQIRAMLWDTQRPYHYVRSTDDGRLLIGGEDTRHRTTRGAEKRVKEGTARLIAYLAELYPDLACDRPEYAWGGLFAETPDGLPYIGPHKRYPKHLFALGYGGNGMTAAFLAARMLLARFQNRPDPDEALFSFGRSRK